jgi:NAD-dependent dihydropyrimidine dehydrogenase PreA subunit
MTEKIPSPNLKDLLMEHGKLALTLRKLKIHFDPERCTGVWECIQVCPVGCWGEDRELGKAIHQHPERCIACGACVLQCPEKAIELRV